jgi:hypothetical protein
MKKITILLIAILTLSACSSDDDSSSSNGLTNVTVKWVIGTNDTPWLYNGNEAFEIRMMSDSDYDLDYEFRQEYTDFTVPSLTEPLVVETSFQVNPYEDWKYAIEHFQVGNNGGGVELFQLDVNETEFTLDNFSGSNDVLQERISDNEILITWYVYDSPI